MLKILPISVTTVNWGPFLVAAKQALGRSITQSLDNQQMKVGDLGSYLSSLAELKVAGTHPKMIAATLFDHIHITFLVQGSEFVITKVIRESRLPTTSVETIERGSLLAVISGTLGQWDFALNTLGEGDTVCRAFCLQVIEIFRQLGIGWLFD